MKEGIALSNIKKWADILMAHTHLTAFPVGVRFIKNDQPLPESAEFVANHRYCQALMQARAGSHVVLQPSELACPAAASAFGFRPLPDNLKSGRGLVGFGIVEKEEVGQNMFAGMKRLSEGLYAAIHLFPLHQATHVPDVVLVEDHVEKLMWISLAAVNANGGKRIEFSTAVLQATCVDCTIIPFLENRINLSYGCYGCREATNLEHSEAALGFPIGQLEAIVANLEFLGQKAIPRSREKRPFQRLSTAAVSQDF